MSQGTSTCDMCDWLLDALVSVDIQKKIDIPSVFIGESSARILQEGFTWDKGLVNFFYDIHSTAVTIVLLVICLSLSVLQKNISVGSSSFHICRLKVKAQQLLFWVGIIKISFFCFALALRKQAFFTHIMPITMYSLCINQSYHTVPYIHQIYHTYSTMGLKPLWCLMLFLYLQESWIFAFLLCSLWTVN